LLTISSEKIPCRFSLHLPLFIIEQFYCTSLFIFIRHWHFNNLVHKQITSRYVYFRFREYSLLWILTSESRHDKNERHPFPWESVGVLVVEESIRSTGCWLATGRASDHKNSAAITRHGITHFPSTPLSGVTRIFVEEGHGRIFWYCIAYRLFFLGGGACAAPLV